MKTNVKNKKIVNILAVGVIILVILSFSYIILSAFDIKPSFITEKIDINYQETEISMPDGIMYFSDFRHTDDGKILASGISDESQAVSVWQYDIDNDSWELIDDYTDDIGFTINENDRYELYSSINSKGQKACMLTTFNDEDFADSEAHYYVSTEDNKFREVLKKGNNIRKDDFNGNATLYPIHLTENGYLLGSDIIAFQLHKTNSYYEYDGLFFKKITGPYIYAIDGDTVYGIKKNSVEVVNLNGDNVEADDTFKFMSKNLKIGKDDYYYSSLAVMEKDDGDNDYYLANLDGIWLYTNTDEGPAKKKLLDGASSLLGECEGSPMSFFAADDENLLITADGNEGIRLLKYTRTGKAVPVNTEFTVYSLRENPTIESLLKKYQRENPNVRIDYEIGIKENEMTYTDAVNKLNTRMLSGKSPDIIFLDEINVQHYVAQSLLMDLSQDIDLSDNIYINSIVSLYENGSTVSAVPCSFAYMCLSQKESGILNTKTLESFTDDITKNKLETDDYSFTDIGVMFYRIYLEPMINSGDLSKDDLQSFYKNLKKIYNSTKKDKDTVASFTTDNMIIQDTMWFMDVGNEGIDISMDYIKSVNSIQNLIQRKNESGLNTTILKNKGEAFAIPQLIAGISKDTKDKEAALDFIDFMLSEGAQKAVASYSGLPVNRDVLKESLKDADENIQVIEDETIILKKLSDNDIKKIINQIQGLDTVINTDSIVMETVMIQAQEHLNGKTSLTKATDNVYKKLKLYLAEHQ